MMIYLAVLIGYFLGSFPTAYLLGRRRGIDIRREGSGNVGTMNTGQVLGWRWGLLVLVLDAGKGALAVIIACQLGANPYPAMIAAVVGHILPLWLEGRGGKGLATALGAVLVLGPWWAILAFALGWIVIYPLLHHSDLANLAGALGVLVYALSVAPSACRWWLALLAVIIAGRHLQSALTGQRTG